MVAGSSLDFTLITIHIILLITFQQLINWLCEDQNIYICKIILLMDNCSIHTSKNTTDFLNGLGWRTVFLPSYSPEYSPIELLFNFLKSKVWLYCKGNSINISKESWWSVIKEWAALFTHDMIVKMFTKWIRQMKMTPPKNWISKFY